MKLELTGNEFGKHPAPETRDLLIRLGGRNPYHRPMFRLIWSGDRHELLGGRICDFNERGEKVRERVEFRIQPRWSPYAMWILEKWEPCDLTREAWKRQTEKTVGGRLIPEFGPYPNEGDYELICKYGSEEPTISVVEKDYWRWIAKQKTPVEDRIAARKARMEVASIASTRAKEEIFLEALKSRSRPVFGYGKTVRPLVTPEDVRQERARENRAKIIAA